MSDAPAPAEEQQPEAPTYPKPPKKKVKTPTVVQMEAVECGAASLGCVLAYYGLWKPLEELRYECGVSRDGSKASNVLRAARRMKLDAKGYKYDQLEKLYELDFPCILFWNFNHFVVLQGFDGEKCYIMDPAQGPRQVTMEELDGSYSGIVLTFSPAEDFEPGGDKPDITSSLRRRLVGSEIPLLFTILCGLLLVIPGLVVPTFSRVFIDEYLIDNQTWLVRPLLWAMGLTIVIQGILTYLQEYYLLRLETRLALSTSASFFNHILRLPAAYFGQRFGGEIGSRVMINDKVAKTVGGKLVTTIIDAVLTIFYALLMMYYSVALTLLVIFISVSNVVVVKLAARLRTDAARRLMQDKGKQMGTAMSGLQMVETLKATGSETEFFGRWAGYHAKTINTEQFLGVLGNVVQAVPAVVETGSNVAVLLFGGFMVMNGDLTVGMLVAYQTLLKSFTRPLSSFVQFTSDIQELQADMNRLDDVLRNPTDPQYDVDESEAHAFDPGTVKLSGRVELKDICFGYSPLDPPLIENFSLAIEPGNRVAFVGGSGSGKSTVAKVISGLYPQWSGELLFDGVPRDKIPKALLSNSLAVVDQEIFLFGGTVTENVTMWDPTIAPDRVVEACRDAQIAEVVESREKAYQSRVDEGGGNFSGGQRQRLEIARALVGEPTIVILDEATSALDPTTELLIDEAMRQRGCTCIIIAHRLSTIKDSDEIVVLERGKIVQRGTHDEMKDVRGTYQMLISM